MLPEEKDEEELEDGTKDETTKEDNETRSESSDESVTTDGERTDAEGDEPDGTREKEDGEVVEEEEPVEEVDHRDAEIAELKTKLADVEKRIGQPRTEETQPKQRTDQEWKDLETRAQLPRETITWVENELKEGLTALGQLMMQHFNKGFAGSAKDKTVENLSKQKEFANIRQYGKDMDEFLKKFDPSTHGNEDLIKSAFYYAKGLNSGKAVKRAMNSTEKNRRVAGTARPASPSGKAQTNKSKGKVNLQLSPTEKQAYDSFGRYSFKTEGDYARSLPRNRAA